jgi:glycosyltransferase involved in cell wall biosynthesis
VVSLADELAAILDSEARAAAVGAAGRRRAAEFSWASCADGLASGYRDAAAERPSVRRRP